MPATVSILRWAGGQTTVDSGNAQYDVDGNGIIDSEDYKAIIDYLNLHGAQPANSSNRQYDVDGDNIINISDALSLVTYLNTFGTITKTAIQGINTVASSADIHQEVAASLYPIKVPETGNNYSYWVSTRLQTGAVGPAGSITNIRWYSDGSNNFGSGVTCKVAHATDYVVAMGTQGVSGAELNNINNPKLVNTPALFTTYISPSPMVVPGSTSLPDTDFGNFVVYQIIIDSSTNAGVSGTETFTWIYDET